MTKQKNNLERVRKKDNENRSKLSFHQEEAIFRLTTKKKTFLLGQISICFLTALAK